MSSLLINWPTIVASAAFSGDEPADADARCVAAARRGEEDAFTELVRRHKRRVFATAARFARDEQQLDDICQDVFVRAFRRLSSFRGDAPFAHWLARITVSACYDFLRKERRVREQVRLETWPYEIADTRAEQALTASRAREFLQDAMRRLAPEEQLILTLCELEERSVNEVATLTGWSVSKVKVRAFRARRALRKIVEASRER